MPQQRETEIWSFSLDETKHMLRNLGAGAAETLCLDEKSFCLDCSLVNPHTGFLLNVQHVEFN